MTPITMEYLENCFKRALQLNMKYVAIALEMKGFEGREVIVNPTENFMTKLEYYKSTYDDKLNHKFAKGIKIVGFTFGNSFGSIEDDLIGY